MPDWPAPDARGVRTAWLTDPNKASLRGKRQRRADPGAPLDLDAWPGAWRSLLAAWVRRATAETRLRWASLLKAAGEAGANNVQPLLDTLLAAGQLELEEHRDPRLGWQSMWVRFTDPAELRARLGIAEPDADLNRWQVLHGQPFEHPELDAARLALDTLPPAIALRRHQILAGLAAWRSEGRHRGAATQRDFAWFCRGDTKAISDSEWRWLGEQVDLAQWGISAHAPLLLLAGTLTLAGPGGFVAVDALSGFLGLPPQAIATVTAIPRPPRQWLLVENRTAFEQAARTLPHRVRSRPRWHRHRPPSWPAVGGAGPRLAALADGARPTRCVGPSPPRQRQGPRSARQPTRQGTPARAGRAGPLDGRARRKGRAGALVHFLSPLEGGPPHPGNEVIDVGEHHWDDQQAEEGRGNEAADHDDGHRRPKTGVGSQPQRDRHHSGTHGYRGHDDRPRPLATGVEQCVPAIESPLAAGEDDVVD